MEDRFTRHVAVFSMMFLACVLVLASAGCSSHEASSPSDSVAETPALGLHSLDETVTVGEREYRLTVEFAPTDRDRVEVMTVHLDYVSRVRSTDGHNSPEIEIAAYGSDGTPRVEPAGGSGPGGQDDESSMTYEGSDYLTHVEAVRPFSVWEGETGIVVSVSDGNGPGIRWLAR